MNPNSAYSLVEIVPGTDYTPEMQYTNHVDPNLGEQSPAGPQVEAGLNSPVYAIMCITSNTSNVELRLLGDEATITFPSGAFVKGVVYYMYLQIILEPGGGEWIGFKYQAHPLVF